MWMREGREGLGRAGEESFVSAISPFDHSVAEEGSDGKLIPKNLSGLL